MVEGLGLSCDRDDHAVALHAKGTTQLSRLAGALGHDDGAAMEQREVHLSCLTF